jgi:hypothetical protein
MPPCSHNQGCSFCCGAREARQLFKIHAKLIMTTEIMASFVLMMARVSCVTFSILLMYACLETTAALPTLGLLGLQKPRISSPTAPMFICGAFSLAIVNCYIDIMEMTIKALLLSYAADRELNDQTGMYAMTTALKNFITGDSNPPFNNVNKHVDPDDKSIPTKKKKKPANMKKNPVADGAGAKKPNPLGLDDKTMGILEKSDKGGSGKHKLIRL